MNRANKPETRNPLLALPSARAMRALPPEARDALAALLADISSDARARANESWRKHKGPMAAYWKAVAVYARHARLTLTARAEQLPASYPDGAWTQNCIHDGR